MSDLDTRFMQLALTLGRRGQGQSWPNPAVGCVIVRDGRVVGRGWTASGGRPHAETQALAQAGPLARGATAYVTLEPCAHHGQTPPCAEALIGAQIARLVAATSDPDARVNGAGFAMLRAAGIAVETGVLQDHADHDLAGFFSRITRGRPMVTVKLANSFDGRIATAQGDSQWITGPAARRYVHGLRARSDAVMVGAGTVRADDPALTVRDWGDVRQPVRVVMTGSGNLPSTSQLMQTARDVPVWVCHPADLDKARLAPWQDAGARLIPCERGQAGLDMVPALSALGSLGLTRVLCEGGGRMTAALLRAGLVDELIGFSAGVLIGAEGLPAIGPLGLNALSEAPRFTLQETRRLDTDVLHIWRPKKD